MLKLTPDLLKQLALAQLLADQSEDEGTQFEEGTYEQGVRDALGWMCGLLDKPPYSLEDYAEQVDEALELFGIGDAL